MAITEDNILLRPWSISQFMNPDSENKHSNFQVCGSISVCMCMFMYDVNSITED